MGNENRKSGHGQSSGHLRTGLPARLAIAFPVILCVIVVLYLLVRDKQDTNPVTEKYGNATMALVYPDMDAGDIQALLKETWSRPYVYEPFTQFRETPFSGNYVNVDENGFRHIANQGPWPPDPEKINIFMFGGSTGFGYGVADDQTIASYLQAHLTSALNPDIRVYNFSRGHYYSTQERIQYEMLLTSGFVPHLAIFLDGLNDFYYNENEPRYTHHIQEFFTRKNSSRTEYLKVRLQEKLSGLLHRNTEQAEISPANTGSDPYDDPAVIERVIQRYLDNKKLIEAASRAYNVQVVFVWQPVPTYNLGEKLHPFAADGYGKHSYSKFGYKRMAEYIETNPPGKNFIWGADLQQDAEGPLYIDIAHYSAGFSRKIAVTIGDILIREYPLLAGLRQ